MFIDNQQRFIHNAPTRMWSKYEIYMKFDPRGGARTMWERHCQFHKIGLEKAFGVTRKADRTFLSNKNDVKETSVKRYHHLRVWDNTETVTTHEEEKKRKTFAWRHRSLQHLLPLTHLWRICATSLHRLLCKLSSTLSHTFSNRAVFACGSVVTFEIWSDASIIARCASHQFVQKVRGRGRLDCPAGELHLLTLHRPGDGAVMIPASLT